MLIYLNSLYYLLFIDLWTQDFCYNNIIIILFLVNIQDKIVLTQLDHRIESN